ncbi:MAG: 8-oxo-dGTP diphosphatase [Clostridia bacterium]|nr:8-oxo-dGTP diphosphatase [Clostridia bacterium]
MARTETVILTNMCLLCDAQGRILVENRIDEHWGGIALPGGHVEPGEPFVASMVREMQEETGLTVEHPKLCGVCQFTHYQGYRYIVLLFCADRFSGELHSSEEGEVFWLDRRDIGQYKTVPDFERILDAMENNDVSEFFYDTDFNIQLL